MSLAIWAIVAGTTFGAGPLGVAPRPYGPQAFFVSPSGSDSANGTSAANPFRTLKRAAAAVLAAGGGTVRIAGGRYRLQEPVTLSETPRPQIWMASGKQRPMLDGGNRVADAIRVRSNHVRISGLGIANFVNDGIVVQAGDDVTIAGNSISAITGPSWNQAAIAVLGDAKRVYIVRNQISRTGYAGIAVFGTIGTSISPPMITGNTIVDVCKRTADCGAIYLLGRVASLDGAIVTGNVINGFGAADRRTVGIYLDDFTSRARVQGNSIAGVGTYAIVIHGGMGNLIVSNDMKITGDAPAINYLAKCCGRIRAMTGNRITGNTVTSTGKTAVLIRETGGGASPELAANQLQ